MSNKRNFHQHLYDCLGEIISVRRRQLRMSQEDLAAETSVDRSFISNLERGQRNPSLGTVASLAEGLRTSLSRLVARCESCVKERVNK